MKNGMLLVNKPEGLSSARVVDKVKKFFHVKKAGHTGTLDPFATGLLPVALGQATRLSRFFLGSAKHYRAVVTLGIETDTLDKTGRILFQADPDLVSSIRPEQVSQVVAKFAGIQQQVAPSFSALKHRGQPLYKLARQGKMIKKPPRTIEIYGISVGRMDLPLFEIDVQCSGGTYIRSLAHDMGQLLGCGAHLSGLCRTGVSQFTLDQAIDLDILCTCDLQTAATHILPMSDCLSFMPLVQADPVLEEKIRFGRKLLHQDIASGIDTEPAEGFFRITGSDGRLIAVVQADNNGSDYNYCCVFTA
ncbi:MAG TPA: tRNA pseudouridine(55) synthase TruB [Desulfotignum sp.]|nr:tRNA pseudouridine(55) synthase TruB [Desulfotignum sp.]